MTAPRITLIATIATDGATPIAIPPNLDADALRAALVSAEEDRLAESRRLAKMFLPQAKPADDEPQ